MINIRQERPEDIQTVRQLLTRAFEKNYEGEAELVDRLRDAEKVTFALVAESEGLVVGHVMYSPLILESAPEGFRGLGLAPLAVLPEYQRQGIGGRLLQESLQQCKDIGYDIVVLLGHPSYYPRFGFSKASEHGLKNEYGVDDPFMVMELREGALAQVSGLVEFQPEFKP
jgi:putative acetyltransferase